MKKILFGILFVSSITSYGLGEGIIAKCKAHMMKKDRDFDCVQADKAMYFRTNTKKPRPDQEALFFEIMEGWMALSAYPGESGLFDIVAEKAWKKDNERPFNTCHRSIDRFRGILLTPNCREMDMSEIKQIRPALKLLIDRSDAENKK
jgi:hypothetical protein